MVLKPCPFCGNAPEVETGERWPRNISHAVTGYFVVCKNFHCPIYMAGNTYYRSETEAVEAWNQRSCNQDSYVGQEAQK